MTNMKLLVKGWMGVWEGNKKMDGLDGPVDQQWRKAHRRRGHGIRAAVGSLCLTRRHGETDGRLGIKHGEAGSDCERSGDGWAHPPIWRSFRRDVLALGCPQGAHLCRKNLPLVTSHHLQPRTARQIRITL